MKHPATYVLVPGSWHGGWSWQPVAKRLRAKGHEAITLTLPGLSHGDDPSGYRLKDAVDYIVGEVRRLPHHDVVLVAHSWGGYPATEAAHALTDRVSKIVYLNAQVPVRGRSLVDDDPPELRESNLRSIAESPTGSIPATFKDVEQALMQDVAPELQRLVADMLAPQPGRYFTDAPDVGAAALAIPTAYLASECDHALQWPAREFAARLDVEPIPVPGTHNALLTHPDEIAAAILAA
ncbi:alpha/beta fold hydrolase [Mycobacterium sp. 852002-51057_SCH5723018]|uniref:alpha/beta fold hydrolase n=1 Tax=Mycobacterium sp. 852002-51057_SCH5723018 TaxID=1834094 RepID=UPI00080209E0|nr:alpha/beta fold hydrolase [Mycobacterium sp. 852002-51057_SCH5723018]OBG29574.1 alpha/beta hydrolase [Mycobacterium sp. 852002-51057_SCH5723018]